VPPILEETMKTRAPAMNLGLGGLRLAEGVTAQAAASVITNLTLLSTNTQR